MSKYKSEILHVVRTSKSTEGGKKISFKVFVITGNFKNTIGLGEGKNEKINVAIEKATLNSYKNLFKISPLLHLKSSKTISYPFECKIKKTKLLFLPNLEGTGIKSNSISFLILRLAGVNNIKVKQIGSNNKMNTIFATVKGLQNY